MDLTSPYDPNIIQAWTRTQTQFGCYVWDMTGMAGVSLLLSIQHDPNCRGINIYVFSMLCLPICFMSLNRNPFIVWFLSRHSCRTFWLDFVVLFMPVSCGWACILPPYRHPNFDIGWRWPCCLDSGLWVERDWACHFDIQQPSNFPLPEQQWAYFHSLTGGGVLFFCGGTTGYSGMPYSWTIDMRWILERDIRWWNNNLIEQGCWRKPAYLIIAPSIPYHLLFSQVGKRTKQQALPMFIVVGNCFCVVHYYDMVACRLVGLSWYALPIFKCLQNIQAGHFVRTVRSLWDIHSNKTLVANKRLDAHEPAFLPNFRLPVPAAWTDAAPGVIFITILLLLLYFSLHDILDKQIPRNIHY